MTRIKEAIAKLEAMKKECQEELGNAASEGLNPGWVIGEVESILADLNVDDLDWKPS